MTTERDSYYRKASGLRIAATAIGTIFIFVLVMVSVLYLLLRGGDYDARCRATESHPCALQ